MRIRTQIVAGIVLCVVAFGQEEKLKTLEKYVKEVKTDILKYSVYKDTVTDEKLEEGALKVARKYVKETLKEEVDELKDAKNCTDFLRKASELKEDGTLENLSLTSLADAMANGYVQATGDHYARVFTMEEMQKLMGQLQGEAAKKQLGFIPVREGEKFTIGFINYGFPAYYAGLEKGDDLLEINGTPVSKINPKEFNTKLEAEPGEVVTLRIKKHGMENPVTIKLEQFEKKPDIVEKTMLKDGIAYLRLTMFSMDAHTKVKKALKELKERGMKKLILDLRNDPGGALPAAVSIADYFLKDGEYIARTESEYEPSFGGLKLPGMGGGNQKFVGKNNSEFESLPLVILVNDSSASASEFLSGALKTAKRGKLIGTTTFGKGIGQSAIPLNSMMMKRFLYMTILKYYFADGFCPDHVGVSPDMEVKYSFVPGDNFADFLWLRENGSARKLAGDIIGKNEDAAKKLAYFDSFETSKYPGFEKAYAKVKAKVSEEEFRIEVRNEIRLQMIKEGKDLPIVDLGEDTQLQTAILELLNYDD